MGSHSIEELKRQMYDALAKAAQATKTARDVEQRYDKARAEASGLLDKKLKSRTGVFLVDTMDFISKETMKPWRISGFLFKKDGSIGANRTTIHAQDGIIEVD